MKILTPKAAHLARNECLFLVLYLLFSFCLFSISPASFIGLMMTLAIVEASIIVFDYLRHLASPYLALAKAERKLRRIKKHGMGSSDYERR